MCICKHIYTHIYIFANLFEEKNGTNEDKNSVKWLLARKRQGEGRDGKLDLSECTLFKSFDFIQPLSLTLCDPMDCSMPGFPVLYYLPEFAQTHVHWVSDTIQPSHPLSPSSLVLNLSQHQGLFQWVSSLQEVAKALELQHQSFQWIFRVDFL